MKREVSLAVGVNFVSENVSEDSDKPCHHLCFGNGSHVDEATSVTTLGKEDETIDKSVECVVLTDTDVETGMVDCTTLTFEDVAGFSKLTAKDFDAEAFAF